MTRSSFVGLALWMGACATQPPAMNADMGPARLDFLLWEDDNGGDNDVFLTRVDAPAFERLTCTPTRERFPQFMRALDRFVFIDDADGHPVIVTRTLSSPDSTPLIIGEKTFTGPARFTVSPNGSHIGFESGGPSSDIDVMEVANGETWIHGNCTDPAWSADDSHMAEVCTDIMNRGSNAISVSATLGIAPDSDEEARYSSTWRFANGRALEPGWYSFPSFSPQGTHLAFAFATDVSYAQIYVVELATGRLEQITNGDHNATTPHWTSDGKHLVLMLNAGTKRYTANGTTPDYDVYRYEFATRALTPMLVGPASHPRNPRVVSLPASAATREVCDHK